MRIRLGHNQEGVNPSTLTLLQMEVDNFEHGFTPSLCLRLYANLVSGQG